MVQLAMVTFFFIAALLALSPGPDNLYLLNQSLQNGKKAGIIFTLGLCSGLALHTIIALLGIGTLIIANAKLFELLKIIGALYLCYLAFVLLRQNTQKKPKAVGKKTLKKLYFQGIIMNLSNPKVLLFFIAFLPQFIDSEQDIIVQILLYGVTFIAATLTVFIALALFGDFLARYFNSSKFFKTMNWLSAGVFVLISINLIF